MSLEIDINFNINSDHSIKIYLDLFDINYKLYKQIYALQIILSIL